MFRITITMSHGASVTRECQDQNEVNEYLEYIKVNGNWGKGEHEIFHPAILDEEGNEITPSSVEVIPAEYTYVVEDISGEVAKKEKLKLIEELEKSITPRRLREAILSNDFTFINNVNTEIEALRNQL